MGSNLQEINRCETGTELSVAVKTRNRSEDRGYTSKRSSPVILYRPSRRTRMARLLVWTTFFRRLSKWWRDSSENLPSVGKFRREENITSDWKEIPTSLFLNWCGILLCSPLCCDQIATLKIISEQSVEWNAEPYLLFVG